MKTINATQARQDIYNLIDETILNSQPIQITGKRGDVVLISKSDWDSIQETLYLSSIEGMEQSIIEGLNTPTEECEELDWENI